MDLSKHPYFTKPWPKGLKKKKKVAIWWSRLFSCNLWDQKFCDAWEKKEIDYIGENQLASFCILPKKPLREYYFGVPRDTELVWI